MVSESALIALLAKYHNKQIIDCSEEIQSFCKSHGYYLNVQDPTMNTHNIDVDTKRVNVMTDLNSRITKVTVG